MTSPVNVGSVSVEVIASAKALAKSLRKEVESAFKDLDISKTIRDSIGTTKIKVPVEGEFDSAGVDAATRRIRGAKIPVDPDMTGFGDKLKAEAALAARRAKATVKINVDVDKDGGGVLGGIGTLFKGLSGALPNLGGIAEGVASLGASIQKVAGSTALLGGNLVGAFTTATGPVGIVIGLLVAVATAAAAIGTAIVGGVSVAIPALVALSGVIAAIPAAIAGAGAGIGTLLLGFKGIGDAFNPKAGGGGGGGGSAVNQARQIAGAARGVEAARRGIAGANRNLEAAERGLATAVLNVSQAQERSRLATEALNRARREAREDIEDLGRALRGARLDEEDAALAVTEALRALNEAKLTGILPDIQRADLAYRQAQLAVENTRDATEDLGAEQADAARQGVEGSDKVQQALRGQVDALQGVKDAQRGVLDAQNAVLSANDGLTSSYDALKSAQDALAQAQAKTAAGGGAAAAELTKLAPAAQKFVDAIKALKPAFEDLRLDVQQRLFAGLDKTVTNVGKAWIPALKTTLGNYADTFNGFFKNLGASITTPKFITDMQAGAEGARQGFAAIGGSVTKDLVPAFGALSKAAGPFMKQLGKEIASVVTEFSNWVLEGEKTGGLKDFFTKASKAMHDIFSIGKSVGSIIASLFEIITGSSPGKDDKNPLETFNAGLKRVAAWLKDPENQQKIRDLIKDVQEAVVKFGKFIKKLEELYDTISGIVHKIDEFKRNFRETLQKFFGIEDDANAKGKKTGGDLGDGLIQGFKDKLAGFSIAKLLWEGPNSLLGRIKSGFGIASPSTVMMTVGRNLIDGLIQGIKNKFTNLATTASQIPGKIRGALGNAASWLTTHGKNAVIGLGNGITSLFGNLRTRAAGLRTQVTNALSGAGTWLVETGRNLVRGLWNGIAALSDWLRGRILGWARAVIPGPLHKFFGIASPSKLMMELGGNIAAGLALGIEGGASGVRGAANALAAELSDVTSLTANASLPPLVTDLGSVSGSLSKSATLEARWADGATGDPFLDAIRRSVKFSYSGNVQAALGSG